jgi:hypothetical protein
MGIFGSIGSAIGANQAGHSLPYRPKGTQELEKYRLGNIRQLQGPDAFKGPGLGLSEEEMQAGIAGPRDYLAGERAAEDQNTADRFRRPGGFGLQSGLYERSLQGIRLNRQNQLAEAVRGQVLENARQSRADAYARLAATGQAFGENTGLWNQRMAVKRGLAQQKAQAIGNAVDQTISAVATGGASLAAG